MSQIIETNVLLVGDCKSGKSSISNRITETSLNYEYKATVGVDFHVKTFNHEGRAVKLRLWDTAGDDRFKSIVVPYYQKAQFIVVVYAPHNRASFEHAKRWMQEAISGANGNVIGRLLVANQYDLNKKEEVSSAQGLQLARRLKANYFKVNAFAGTGITEMLNYIILKTVDYHERVRPPPETGTIKRPDLHREDQQNKYNRRKQCSWWPYVLSAITIILIGVVARHLWTSQAKPPSRALSQRVSLKESIHRSDKL